MNNNNNNQVANEDDLFFEAVGGWDAKGRLYGLGCAGESYYGKLKILKRQRATNADLRMKVADQQKQIDELRAILEQLTQTHCGHRSSPNFPPTSPPPSSSGQGIAA